MFLFSLIFCYSIPDGYENPKQSEVKNMATCRKRFDAAGHRILSREDMLSYYQNDRASLDIVKRNMPYRYVVIPAIEILIDKQNPGSVDVYLIFPGETKLIEKDVSVRAVEGLRATYRGKPGWVVKGERNGAICLRREGRIVLDPMRRFGVWG